MPLSDDYLQQAIKALSKRLFDEELVKTNSRIRQMLVAGGIELIKILCPPLGIPIEMGQKWLETEMGQKWLETAQKMESNQ